MGTRNSGWCILCRKTPICQELYEKVGSRERITWYCTTVTLLLIVPYVVPFWGQTTWNFSGLSPKRDCSTKRGCYIKQRTLEGSPFRTSVHDVRPPRSPGADRRINSKILNPVMHKSSCVDGLGPRSLRHLSIAYVSGMLCVCTAGVHRLPHGHLVTAA